VTLDYDLFDRQILKEEHRLALILKGHLWAEACINRALEVALVDASGLHLEREAFSRKITLATSLDALPGEVVPFFRALNRVRNKIAHELEKELEDGDVAALEASIAEPLKAKYLAVFRGDSSAHLATYRFKVMVLLVVMLVEHTTMIREYEKEHRHALSTWRLLVGLRDRIRETNHPLSVNEEVMETFRPPPPPDLRDVWSDWAAARQRLNMGTA